jgi:hypothetical protein
VAAANLRLWWRREVFHVAEKLWTLCISQGMLFSSSVILRLLSVIALIGVSLGEPPSFGEIIILEGRTPNEVTMVLQLLQVSEV